MLLGNSSPEAQSNDQIPCRTMLNLGCRELPWHKPPQGRHRKDKLPIPERMACNLLRMRPKHPNHDTVLQELQPGPTVLGLPLRMV
jgi:hypothetical protein